MILYNIVSQRMEIGGVGYSTALNTYDMVQLLRKMRGTHVRGEGEGAFPSDCRGCITLRQSVIMSTGFLRGERMVLMDLSGALVDKFVGFLNR